MKVIHHNSRETTLLITMEKVPTLSSFMSPNGSETNRENICEDVCDHDPHEMEALKRTRL